MFWHSVIGGLAVLTYWQTYVAGLEYLAIFMVPMGAVAVVAMRAGKAETAIGCLSMLIMPVFQVFAIVVFVLTLSPIILGVSHGAAWGFPWALAAQFPEALARFVGLLLVAGFILAFIPILGRVQSFHTLVLGALALLLFVELLARIRPDLVPHDVHFWPGFWFAVALLIIGGVMAWIGTLVVAFLLTSLGSATEGLGELLMFPVVATFGFIPVFIYGAWLGAQFGSA